MEGHHNSHLHYPINGVGGDMGGGRGGNGNDQLQQQQQPNNQEPRPLTGVTVVYDVDVLCGRGGAALRHPGNQTYRRLVNLNKGLYITCLKTEKLKISRSIVAAIREQQGRFLEKESGSSNNNSNNPSESTWYDIGDKKAIEKTSQALREGQPKLRQKIVELSNNNPNGGGPGVASAVVSMPMGTATAVALERQQQHYGAAGGTGGMYPAMEQHQHHHNMMLPPANATQQEVAAFAAAQMRQQQQQQQNQFNQNRHQQQSFEQQQQYQMQQQQYAQQYSDDENIDGPIISEEFHSDLLQRLSLHDEQKQIHIAQRRHRSNNGCGDIVSGDDDDNDDAVFPHPGSAIGSSSIIQSTSSLNTGNSSRQRHGRPQDSLRPSLSLRGSGAANQLGYLNATGESQMSLMSEFSVFSGGTPSGASGQGAASMNESFQSIDNNNIRNSPQHHRLQHHHQQQQRGVDRLTPSQMQQRQQQYSPNSGTGNNNNDNNNRRQWRNDHPGDPYLVNNNGIDGNRGVADDGGRRNISGNPQRQHFPSQQLAYSIGHENNSATNLQHPYHNNPNDNIGGGSGTALLTDRRQVFARMKYTRPPSTNAMQTSSHHGMRGGAEVDGMPEIHMVNMETSQLSLLSNMTDHNSSKHNPITSSYHNNALSNSNNTGSALGGSFPSSQTTSATGSSPSVVERKLFNSAATSSNINSKPPPNAGTVGGCGGDEKMDGSSLHSTAGNSMLMDLGSRHSIMSGLSRISDTSIDASIFSNLSKQIGSVSTRSIPMSEISAIETNYIPQSQLQQHQQQGGNSADHPHHSRGTSSTSRSSSLGGVSNGGVDEDDVDVDEDDMALLTEGPGRRRGGDYLSTSGGPSRDDDGFNEAVIERVSAADFDE